MEVLGCLTGLLKIKSVVDVSICYGVFLCISKSGMETQLFNPSTCKTEAGRLRF